MMEAAFSAIRLSCWGLGLVLGWLVACRLRDRWTARELTENEHPISAIHPVLVLFVAGLLSLTTLLAFTAAVINSMVVWLLPRYPLVGYSSLICLFMILAIFIRQVAYYPAHKMRFCLAWLTLSHMAVWGQAWLQQG